MNTIKVAVRDYNTANLIGYIFITKQWWNKYLNTSGYSGAILLDDLPENSLEESGKTTVYLEEQ